MAVGQHGRWWRGAGDARSRPRESAFPWDARSDHACLASEFGQRRFWIGRDEENGAILEGQRNTEVYLSAARSFERLVFFP